jgi:hypothetical protein
MFDISRLRRADQIIAGGGIFFFIALIFFKWWGFGGTAIGISGAPTNVGFSFSGWHTYADSRWIWIITIILALGSVVLVAMQRKLELPVASGVIVGAFGALSAILIIYRIISPLGSGYLGASGGGKIGIYLGLIGALAVTYGGYMSMKEEGTSIADVRGQASQAFSGLTAPSGGSSPPPPASSGPPIPPPAAPPEPESTRIEERPPSPDA